MNNFMAIYGMHEEMIYSMSEYHCFLKTWSISLPSNRTHDTDNILLED